jgi:hypothetical protein
MTDAPDEIWTWVDYDAHYLRATPARLHAEELLGALREIHRDLLDMRLTLLTEGEDLDPRIKRVTDICAYFLARVEGETND